MSANQNSFWGAYLEGNDLPYIFVSHAMAKERCRELARNNTGLQVWLLKCEVIGSVIKPLAELVCSGEMK